MKNVVEKCNLRVLGFGNIRLKSRFFHWDLGPYLAQILANESPGRTPCFILYFRESTPEPPCSYFVTLNVTEELIVLFSRTLVKSA